ncbi:MAG: ABC transporter substrate-binding protein [Streptosporangiales bacterium]|nr:ABC transporter substrate-binding protein [Streptosporangiales bacterium]MBO0891892.1 ABC transporter substrate-binding protein [Acidothermales bacterium]
MLAGAAVLAGCSGKASGNDDIVVGYEVPLTGIAAPDGVQERDGWNLGLKTFGNKVDGHKIVTHFVDTHSDPNTALTDAKNLVQVRHINILEGPLLANEVGAVASFVDPQKIPVDDLTLCSGQQLTNYQKFGNGLASGWSCDQPDLMAAVYLYQTKKLRHVTVLANDYAFGWLSASGFIKQFTALGGHIDKVLWPPTTTADWSPYVSGIPDNTQAVFAEVVGQGSVSFTSTYQKYGLHNKIPLYGNTTVFDYSVMPQESPKAVLGDEMAAQYCDGINSPANNKFTADYFKAYHTYPGYYAEAAYTKARLVVEAMKKLHGDASDKAKVTKALRTTPIVAPRGPVKISPKTWSPIENNYICKVKMIGGHLRNVPIKTYQNVQPWGQLDYQTWKQQFMKSANGRPKA